MQIFQLIKIYDHLNHRTERCKSSIWWNIYNHDREETLLKNWNPTEEVGRRLIVGKTTLAQKLSDRLESTYIDLEDPRNIQKIGDPSYYFYQHNDRLIIIDEVQRRPDLFTILRSPIDRNRRKGHKVSQFLLLFSASNELLNQSSESLAWRLPWTLC